MSESKVRLLYSRTNVFIQFNDDVCLPGVLCTFEESQKQYVFSWMSEDKISEKDMNIYREVENSKEVILPDSENGYFVTYDEELIKNSISAPLNEIASFGTTVPTEWYVGIVLQLKNELYLPTFFIQKKQFEEDIDVYTQLASWFSILGKNVYRTINDTGSKIYKVCDENEEIDESSTLIGKNQEPESTDLGKFIEDAKFNLLLKFSKVTQKGKEAAAHILGAPVSKPLVPLLPKSFVNSILSKEEVKNICDEYDAARQYLRLMSKEMQEKALNAINQTINLGNYNHYQKLNQETEWHEEQYITEIIKSIEHDEQEILFNPSTNEEDNEWQNIEMPDFNNTRTGNPITAEQWVTFYDNEGKLTKTEEELRDIIYRSGLENDIRMDAWKYLLNIFPWDSTEEKRKEINLTLKQSYDSLKEQWKKILENGPSSPVENESEESPQNANAGDERFESDIYKRIMDRKYRIEKDVLRTDRTIPMYSNSSDNLSSDKPVIYENIETDTSEAGWNSNLELLRDILVTYTFLENDNGYVQGMSDLLAPILGVFRSESDTFWCFNEFMEKYKNNFHRNQEEMKNQLSLLLDLIRLLDIELYEHFEKLNCLHLFFCFRWLLVIFKREFDFYDCMRVWETMWAQKKSDYYQLFIAVAILKENKAQLFGLESFDDTLKYINNLSTHIKVEPILGEAESLYKKFIYRYQELKDRLINEKINYMKKDQENGVVHMEVFNENDNGEQQQNNNSSDISELAQNEILKDPISIINRLAKLSNEIKIN
ncbi:RabGAP/TBC [Anaeromyces robustus]|uniref:RabGAP/TBC n=1 Tax=Anaeromyces robustus TaxID=1754192 RepID=A0A1Y1XP77_9FUNG|nr:RabGAP/TBC [Anaeromyces robustus]|eukprot:ORX87547.1 RabGAP/TBC [Anaeromyces robustus]